VTRDGSWDEGSDPMIIDDEICACGHPYLRHIADQGPCYDCDCKHVRHVV